MKLINQIIVCFSFIALASSLEGKTVEVLLDHVSQETLNFNDNNLGLEENPFESPLPSHPYFNRLKIENIGNQPVKNCFPFVNQAPFTTLESLADYLADQPNPLLSLFQLWKQSVAIDDSVGENHCHPLDLMNFKGVSTRKSFTTQFITLCNALGIETRLANVHGKPLYDFCLEDEWNLLDLNQQQIYLALDNERVVSSEEIMDDPFLALRTMKRQGGEIDFNEAWKQLARFEILHPAPAQPVLFPVEKLSNRSEGFDLYPGEKLVFETQPDLSLHKREISHVVNMESRGTSLAWSYHSPVPIQKVKNQSSAKMRLVDQKIDLKPGETYTLAQENVFQLKLEFSQQPKGEIVLSGSCAWKLFPNLVKGENQIHLGSNLNSSTIRLSYESDENLEKYATPSLNVLNSNDVFHYSSPRFLLGSRYECEKIWWQISPDANFHLASPNLDQVEPYSSSVTLPLISETFLSEGKTYYFRVKGCTNGKWGDWSAAYAFEVAKPAAVEEVAFNSIDKDLYELNWERSVEETDAPIEYLVFGSNSLDFIPSIYCGIQVNAIADGEIVEREVNDNLVAITHEPKIEVTGGLAYYRIIAKQHGQLSVPSPLIHVYDDDLIQPRNVLQLVDGDQQRITAKRSLFPPSYPWTHISLPLASASKENSLIKIHSLFRSATSLEKTKYSYEFPDVSEEIWEEVRPYLLPSNHPAWPKLNRVFCKTRATLHSEAFRKAGFKRWRPGRYSRVSASTHSEFIEYFIKAYCDIEVGILYDWKKWIHRIRGAEMIRNCIKEYNLSDQFKVPHKWIYPLPKDPSPSNSSRYLRKNFILVCENMRIQEHSTNEKMYKSKMNSQLMKGLYTILQVCGLYDSVYCFNIPFCHDGRMAVIDTEYHHKWPVPFAKMTHYFSSKYRSYWKKLTYKGGKIPDGVNEYNPPRMDRRDHIPNDKLKLKKKH